MTFAGDWSTVCRANLWLRTANRVLVELGRFVAPDGDALWAEGRRLAAGPLAELFHPDLTFALQATVARSPIRDARWAALRFKDGLVDGQRDRWGRRASVDTDEPVLPLRLRLQGEEATILLDTSGQSLDRRGYRTVSVGAPARETLAAACVLAAGWDGKGPIVDPMCGTGTLLAEAASFALGRPPAFLRTRFACERFPGFDPAILAAARAEARPGPATTVALFGGDRSLTAVASARRNLAAAGLGDHARLLATPATDFPAPRSGPGLFLVNPPHGERLAADREMWRALGDLMKRRFAGWRAVVLAGGEGLGKEIGLRPKRRIPVRNGPLEGRILVFELY